MIQTRKMSMIESLTNMAIGYLVAVGSTFLVFPLFDIEIQPSDNFAIGAYFTAISLARSYAIRRWYNGRR